MARSSPFICVADTLEVLIALCLYTYQEGSICEAARLVNWRIARTRLGSGESKLEASAVEKHPWTFTILFLATLVPAIKFLGLQGLFWTRVWAGIYLCSYIVLAIVRALASKGWRDRPPVAPLAKVPSFHEKLLGIVRIVLLVVAGAVHASVSYWALICAQRQFEEIYMWPSHLMVGLKFVQLGLTMVMAPLLIRAPLFPLYFYFMGVDLTWRSITAAPKVHHKFDWIPTAAAILLGSIHISLMMGFGYPNAIIYLDIVSGVWPITLCFGLLFLLFTILSILSNKVPFLNFLKIDDGDYKALLVFPFLNFILALLYYRVVYDPTGTAKPSWTEELG